MDYFCLTGEPLTVTINNEEDFYHQMSKAKAEVVDRFLLNP